MAPPGKSDIKVTASDALEFEPVIHEPPQRRWGLKMFVVFVLAAGGVAGWHYYGDRLRQLWGGADAGIPFIRAATTPVKVRPDNPGGLEVPDRDKLVYDRIQGKAEGRGPERLLPPPEQPLPKPATAATPAPRPPAPEKAATAAPTPSPPLKPVARVPTAKDVATAERPAPPPPPPAPPSAPRSTPPAAATPPRPDATGTPKPKAAVTGTATPAPEKPAEKPAEKLPEKLNVPAPPPAAPKTAAAPASPPPVAAAAPAPAGKAYLVQLAAARTQQGAEAEWEKLRSKNQDILGNLRLTVTRADLGPAKGIFYRLRAGPIADESAARALCSQLSKRQIGCLVIKPGQ